MGYRVEISAPLWLFVAVVLLCTCTGKKSDMTHKCCQECDKIDENIKSLRHKIDSVRRVAPDALNDSLMKYDAYRYVVENRAAADSLVLANKELLSNAYYAARKNSIFNVPRRNETVFSDFCDVAAVKRIRLVYYANKRKITRFARAADEMRPVIPAVKNHFDSVANSQIYELQLKMDSALNQKAALLSGHKVRQK